MPNCLAVSSSESGSNSSFVRRDIGAFRSQFLLDFSMRWQLIDCAARTSIPVRLIRADCDVLGTLLAILAIEKVAHRLPAGLVGFTLNLAFDGIHGTLRYRFLRLGNAALGAAIGETRFVGFQLEFL